MARTHVPSVRAVYTFICGFIMIIDAKPFGGNRATRGVYLFQTFYNMYFLLRGPNRNIAVTLKGIGSFP